MQVARQQLHNSPPELVGPVVAGTHDPGDVTGSRPGCGMTWSTKYPGLHTWPVKLHDKAEARAGDVCQGHSTGSCLLWVDAGCRCSPQVR